MFERLGTLEETVATHADFLTDERISELAVDIRDHPAEYSAAQEASSAVACAKKALLDVLGQNKPLLTELIEAINRREGCENELIYKLGFYDGARIYHALVSHELPHQLEVAPADLPYQQALKAVIQVIAENTNLLDRQEEQA